MADVIEGANVLHAWHSGGRWYAAIGPEDRGLIADGPTAPAAILALAVRCDALGWTFDETWKPRSYNG